MKQIPLSQNKFTFVDDEDFDELIKYKWCAKKDGNTFYAIRNLPWVNGKHTTLSMHRSLIARDSILHIDHIDGNGLNNTRANLRLVTHRQNMQNMHIKKSSIYIGVSWYARDNTWKAQIRICGKNKHIGYFDKEIDAHIAYIKAMKSLGEMML
jgi:hypothetical protein